MAQLLPPRLKNKADKGFPLPCGELNEFAPDAQTQAAARDDTFTGMNSQMQERFAHKRNIQAALQRCALLPLLT